MNKPHFGIIGLGVMGRSLATNVASNNIPLSVYNRMAPSEEQVIPNFMESVASKSVEGFTELPPFIESLSTPRSILLMVNAGAAVDSVIESLTPLLSPGDVIIDGGNSHYKDTQRRVRSLQEKQLHFIGAGISGGEEGALKGPSIMIGGDMQAYNHVAPIFEAIAAKDANGKPCVSLLGTDGCGHLVKTIHNGIEYAEMQLLAECYALLLPTHTNEEISNIFKQWNDGELESYLLGITAEILVKKDGDGDEYLLDKVLDKAGSKGTGSWSSQIAFQLGTSASMIDGAVTARYISSLKEKRVRLAGMIRLENNFQPIDVEALRKCYSFARIINHYQGFEIIKAAAKENNWDIQLSEIARIWTAGCIIKSDLMEYFSSTFKQVDDILELTSMTTMLAIKEKEVVKTLNYSINNRISSICISSSYNFFISMTSGLLPANLIQAQRDEFGAHTYRRIDKQSDQSFTTKWTTNG